MRILFFGTPPFAARSLAHLLEREVEVVGVVTRADKPQGRSLHTLPSAVKQLVLERVPHLSLFQPEKVSAPEWAEPLRRCGADLFVVVAFGEIIKQHLLEMPPRGCINLHASLLPKLRGAAPIQRAIMSGERETGVTIIKMVKKMDAGPMIRSASLPIGEGMTFGQLEEELLALGAPLLFEVIRAFERGDPPAVAQQESEATFAPKVELEECELRWNRRAEELERLVRAANPYPGAWCWVSMRGDRKRLKVWRAAFADGGERSPFCAETASGPLALCEVQLEGRRRMEAAALLRGLSPGELTLL